MMIPKVFVVSCPVGACRVEGVQVEGSMAWVDRHLVPCSIFMFVHAGFCLLEECGSDALCTVAFQ